MAKIKPELEQLIIALECSLTARVKDECGDWRVVGRKGHIYVEPEGFYIYHDAGSKQAWTWAKKTLAFCKVTQDGDEEGMLLLDRLPDPMEAEVIRGQLGIRKLKVISDKERERLKTAFKPLEFREKLPSGNGEAQ